MTFVDKERFPFLMEYFLETNLLDFQISGFYIKNRCYLKGISVRKKDFLIRCRIFRL